MAIYLAIIAIASIVIAKIIETNYDMNFYVAIIPSIITAVFGYWLIVALIRFCYMLIAETKSFFRRFK